MYTAYCYVLHRLASLSPQQSLPGAEQTTATYKLQIHLVPSVTSHVDGHTRVLPSSQLINSSSVTTLSVTLPDISIDETNVMHFLFNLLKIKGLYMFRALLAHTQEALHKQHLV
jgi:hypothetical protein